MLIMLLCQQFSRKSHTISAVFFPSKLLKSDLYIEHGDLPAATTRVRFPWKKCSKLFGMAYNFWKTTEEQSGLSCTSTQVIILSKLFGSLGKKVAWISRSFRLEAKLSDLFLLMKTHETTIVGQVLARIDQWQASFGNYSAKFRNTCSGSFFCREGSREQRLPAFLVAIGPSKRR